MLFFVGFVLFSLLFSFCHLCTVYSTGTRYFVFSIEGKKKDESFPTKRRESESKGGE